MYSYKCVCKSWKYNILYIMHVLKYTYCHCLIEYFIMTIKLTLISLTITVKLINPILTALYFLQNYCWYDYSCGLRNFCFLPGRARGNFVCRRGGFFYISKGLLALIWYCFPFTLLNASNYDILLKLLLMCSFYFWINFFYLGVKSFGNPWNLLICMSKCKVKRG